MLFLLTKAEVHKLRSMIYDQSSPKKLIKPVQVEKNIQDLVIERFSGQKQQIKKSIFKTTQVIFFN